jgi:Na+-transporting NADH:ubiquinone oxidoreductase subunit NqrA
MQICMKVKPGALVKLQQQLAERSAAPGVNYSKIGKSAGVHPSHVSRICRGDFKKLSQNVVQICSALGIAIEGFIEAEHADPAAARLIQGVLAVWDRSDADADRISRFLDQLRELRDSS